MLTIFQHPLIYKKNLEGKLVFLIRYLKYKISLEKHLTQALNFKEMEANLTNFLKMGMNTIWVK